jgi:multidrug efflux pump subunit AcrA (membrane-fusion protein)
MPSRVLVVAAVTGLALAGCAHEKPQRQKQTPTVKTVTSKNGVLHPTEMLAGIIAPMQNVAITSSLSEPTDEVYVKEGDRVTKGEVLARLDTADLEAQLAADLATAHGDAANATHTVYTGSLAIAQSQQSVNSAQAAVRQAQETLTKDATDLQRYQNLVTNGYISEQQVAQQSALVRNDQQAVRSAQASLESAREQVSANGTLGSEGLQSSAVEQARATQDVALAQADQVRTSIAKATIVSPIDGVVVNRNLNPGEYPGTRQLFTLQQVDPLYAVLRGSGAQIAQIAVGANASIVASDLRDAKRNGRVVGVLNQINPGSTDFVVKVELGNPDYKLRPGMAIEGSIALPPVSGVQIPETAFTDDTHTAVLVVASDGTVSTAKVTEIGSDGTSAVVSGLGIDKRVIGDGQTSVGNGEKVAVR